MSRTNGWFRVHGNHTAYPSVNQTMIGL